MAPKRKRARAKASSEIEENGSDVPETVADELQQDGNLQEANHAEPIPAAPQGRTARMEQMAEIAQR